MHVIATAGHVDHGKSSLVKALTGIDPDRLEEEKRRGLTIDLGFAWLKLPSDNEVGIVDVPGHERFIKNMLAGVGATDLALFVVAANEGWQPQSQEHLDILDLLGFDAGIFVITKTDLVSQRQLNDLVEEVMLRIQNTSLKRSPVSTVSSKTGHGLKELIQHLDDLVGRAKPPRDLGRPRLWIDRAFSIKGSGTVVTGTLIDGSFEKDQEVEIVNKGLRARIRSIQSHRSDVPRIGPGNRTALNLVSVEAEKVGRGDVLSLPGTFRTSAAFVAKLRFLDLGFDPSARGSFKVYLGSAELDCRLTFIGETPPRGGEGFVLLRINGPDSVASLGDRIVLRDSGRRRTLAGGTIVDPFPQYFGSPKAADALAKARARATVVDQQGYLEVLLDEVEAIRVQDSVSITGLSPDSFPGVRTRTFALAQNRYDDLTNKIEGLVRSYQSQNPLDPGMPRVQIDVAASRGLSEELIDLLVEQGRLVGEGAFVRTPEHSPQTDTPEAMELLNIVEDSGYAPPLMSELNQRFDPSLVRSLLREGRLVQIDHQIAFTRAKMDELRSLVVTLVENEGPFTVARFRDAAGTSRKYAVPLLEYLDSQGITKRQGDLRTLGHKS